MAKLLIRLAGMTVLCASTALAAPDKVDDKVNAARVECAAGNYQAGVRLLAEVWVETEDPTYIYNQGRCYEQNGKKRNAADRFREYLQVDKTVDPKEARELEARIAALQAEAGQEGTGMRDSKIGDANLISAPQPRQPEPRPPIYKRWWLWAGVGAVVAGAVTTLVLLSRRDGTPCSGASHTCLEVP